MKISAIAINYMPENLHLQSKSDTKYGLEIWTSAKLLQKTWRFQQNLITKWHYQRRPGRESWIINSGQPKTEKLVPNIHSRKYKYTARLKIVKTKMKQFIN